MMNPLNPFDLHGPAFLAFYTMVGTAVVGALVWLQRRREATTAPSAPLSDPYLVASLRNGEVEAVNLAVVALLDRGLLEADDTWLCVTDRAADARVDAPLERALLAYFAEGPGRVQGALEEPAVRVELRPLENALLDRGLVPDAIQHRARRVRLAQATVLMWVVAAVQVLNRDPAYGIVFLVVLAIAFPVLAAYVSFRPRTPAGDRLLADMRELFGGQRHAFLAPAGADHAPNLMLAVYGLSILPGTEWGFLDKVLPGARRPAANESGNACGGGCGSSGCASSGSGCGGGDGGSGCGGGGGCGGCGCGG